jgi:hypothetical protein
MKMIEIDEAILNIKDPIERQKIRTFLTMDLNQKQKQIEKEEKNGKNEGIHYRRIRSFDYGDRPVFDFNTFFNEHMKDYKSVLLNNDEDKEQAYFVLIERHNLERLTTRYDLYPTEDQTVQIESHMHVQRNVDNPDYYMQIFHVKTPRTNDEVIVFIGCPKGRWIGRTESFVVERQIKYDMNSNVKGFRQIKFPLRDKNSKWSVANRLV